jgi:hypothetical protein
MKTKTQLMKKADKLYSQTRREEIGHCECCGRKESLQLAHIISRDCRKLRYCDDNTFVLCYSCHFTFHRKPLEFSEFVKCKKGEAVYKWLIRESNKLKPVGIEFYNKIIKQYE